VPVRVPMKLRARATGRVLETSVLVNTGFTGESPQILLPRGAAEEPGLWPARPG
jgi:predicted aspartyl protease